jgi:hypothetical protein
LATGYGHVTGTGVVLGEFVPSPFCPSLFGPQQYGASLTRAQVTPAPTAIACTFAERPLTGAGALP